MGGGKKGREGGREKDIHNSAPLLTSLPSCRGLEAQIQALAHNKMVYSTGTPPLGLLRSWSLISHQIVFKLVTYFQSYSLTQEVTLEVTLFNLFYTIMIEDNTK